MLRSFFSECYRFIRWRPKQANLRNFGKNSRLLLQTVAGRRRTLSGGRAILRLLCKMRGSTETLRELGSADEVLAVADEGLRLASEENKPSMIHLLMKARILALRDLKNSKGLATAVSGLLDAMMKWPQSRQETVQNWLNESDLNSTEP